MKQARATPAHPARSPPRRDGHGQIGGRGPSSAARGRGPSPRNAWANGPPGLVDELRRDARRGQEDRHAEGTDHGRGDGRGRSRSPDPQTASQTGGRAAPADGGRDQDGEPKAGDSHGSAERKRERSYDYGAEAPDQLTKPKPKNWIEPPAAKQPRAIPNQLAPFLLDAAKGYHAAAQQATLQAPQMGLLPRGDGRPDSMLSRLGHCLDAHKRLRASATSPFLRAVADNYDAALLEVEHSSALLMKVATTSLLPIQGRMSTPEELGLTPATRVDAAAALELALVEMQALQALIHHAKTPGLGSLDVVVSFAKRHLQLLQQVVRAHGFIGHGSRDRRTDVTPAKIAEGAKAVEVATSPQARAELLARAQRALQELGQAVSTVDLAVLQVQAMDTQGGEAPPPLKGPQGAADAEAPPTQGRPGAAAATAPPSADAGTSEQEKNGTGAQMEDVEVPSNPNQSGGPACGLLPTK